MKIPSWFVEEGTSLNELIAFAEKLNGVAEYVSTNFMELGRNSLKFPRKRTKPFWIT